MSSNDIWNNHDELSRALKERQEHHRKRYTRSSSDEQKDDEDMKKEIRQKSKSPTEEIMNRFPDDVKSELYDHENKMRENPNLSSMVPIPLPNKSRRQPEYPYEPKSNTRGGVKKRRTKKRKNKKSKKSKRKSKKSKRKQRKTRRRK
jgi:hypothetical protein